MHDKRYTESEHYLKRLAYVCFLNKKFSESEKYFKVGVDMVPLVTKNPVNIFIAQKNLLLLYTYTNIDNASTFGDNLIK
jgi:hypothetical protein